MPNIIYNDKHTKKLHGYPLGPYFIENGQVHAIEGQGVWRFVESESSWINEGDIYSDLDFLLDGVRSTIVTDAGTILVLSPNVHDDHKFEHGEWEWDAGKWDAPGAHMHGMVLRKPSNSQWENPRTVIGGYCAAIQSVIQLDCGRIVAAGQKFIPKMYEAECKGARGAGGHTAVLSIFSDDDGITWQQSQILSPYDCYPRPKFHPKGNHGGLLEPSIIQIDDKSILMLIRTNWGELWTATSDDKGASWRSLRPSGIEASAAPCALENTVHGILIVWNRPNSSAPKHERKPLIVGGGEGSNETFSEVPVSFHGGELSAAIIDPNNLDNWSENVRAIAWVENQHQGALKYPKIFMKDNDTAWITTSPAKSYSGDTQDEPASARMSLNVPSILVPSQVKPL